MECFDSKFPSGCSICPEPGHRPQLMEFNQFITWLNTPPDIQSTTGTGAFQGTTSTGAPQGTTGTGASRTILDFIKIYYSLLLTCDKNYDLLLWSLQMITEL